MIWDSCQYVSVPETITQIKFCSADRSCHTAVFPDTKLQTLDRRVGKDQLYFDRTQFAASLDAWDGIPVIFQKHGVHPDDFRKVAENPSQAAEDIGGILVGSVSRPRIVVAGGPRLMAQLNIENNEDEIVRLWNQGKLFPSTAFTAASDGNRIVSPPIPNHVLLFPINVDTVLPGDYGAYVNTMEISQSMESRKQESIETTQPNFFNRVREAVDEVLAGYSDRSAVHMNSIESQVPADITEELAEKDAEIAQLKESIEQLTASHTAELETMSHELEKAKEELAILRSEQAEHRFTAILNALPVGMTATASQRDVIRSQVESGDIEGLLFSVLKNTMPKGSTQPAGDPYVDMTRGVPLNTVGDLNHPHRSDE